MKFEDALARVLTEEGGYSNHPADPGGETMYGITKSVAAAYGYTGPMKDLPPIIVKSIYKRLYWDACRCEELPDALRYPVFDAAVNSGPARAIKWLQAAVGVGQDGVIGPVTLAAVAKHDPQALRAKMLAARLKFMADLPHFATFGRGWVRRVARILEGD